MFILLIIFLNFDYDWQKLKEVVKCWIRFFFLKKASCQDYFWERLWNTLNYLIKLNALKMQIIFSQMCLILFWLAEAERSFSSLELIKNCRCATIGQEQLNHLTLLLSVWSCKRNLGDHLRICKQKNQIFFFKKSLFIKHICLGNFFKNQNFSRRKLKITANFNGFFFRLDGMLNKNSKKGMMANATAEKKTHNYCRLWQNVQWISSNIISKF